MGQRRGALLNYKCTCSLDIVQCITEEWKANLKEYVFLKVDIYLMISLICGIHDI